MEVYQIPNGDMDNLVYYITLDKSLPGVLVDVWYPEKV